ncbi:hypothetical protein [Sorangium cellulosum]|uniref:hypothetical protein n=1 Tax=Sorangium cellulosum TaxID=56 RepID=UPI0013312AC7|nr:hypothetical protein [Sorangium cellulosum]
MIFFRPVDDVLGAGAVVDAVGAVWVGVVVRTGRVVEVCAAVGLVAGVVGLGCGRGGGGVWTATGAGSTGGGSGVVVAGGGCGGSLATDAGAGGASTTGSEAASSEELPLRAMKTAVVRPPITTKAPTPINASVGPELLPRDRAPIGGGSAPTPSAWGAPPA